MTDLGLLREPAKSPVAPQKYPFVTVVMPVRNEADWLERSLGAVYSQDYPRDRMEVVVADGMSTDGTREIVQRWTQSWPGLRLIDNAGGIVPTGMNAALRVARGEIIVRVDGHCEIAVDYISKCVQHLAEEGVDGVGGSVETVGATPTARAIALAMSSHFGVGGAAFRTVQGKSMIADTVPFPAYRRTLIDRAGLYDEELVRNQDDEYNYRLRKLGARLLLASDVRSLYFSRSSFGSLWRQYFQYGFWKVRVLQKHPAQMKLRQFIPPAFVLGLSMVAAGAIFSLASRLLLAGVVTIYALAAGLAALVAAGKSEWGLGGRVGLAFATLHLAYGSGFLWGMIHFRSRWRG